MSQNTHWISRLKKGVNKSDFKKEPNILIKRKSAKAQSESLVEAGYDSVDRRLVNQFNIKEHYFLYNCNKVLKYF